MNKAVRITLRQIYIYTEDDLDKYAYVHISYYKRREGKGMGGWRSRSTLRAASASVASRFLKWAHLEGGGLWANSKRCVMGYRHVTPWAETFVIGQARVEFCLGAVAAILIPGVQRQMCKILARPPSSRMAIFTALTRLGFHIMV